MLDLFHLVLQIAVILVAARLVGFLFQKIHQPQVMGEMVAGILLGPSLLGWLAPGVSASLFPPASLGYLNALSQVGLVVFMFVVGLALNPSELRGYGHAAVLTSHVSIAAPFCLGGLTALYLYPRLSDDGVTFTGFALAEGFRHSNRMQAAAAAAFLERAGFRIESAEAPVEPLVLTAEEIESLAEMEHGRWVVERLQQGWRYDDVRDTPKKLHPDLVGWAKLPDGVRDWDRSAVRNWPRLLADAGLRVVRTA
jgi:hypothetical protein